MVFKLLKSLFILAYLIRHFNYSIIFHTCQQIFTFYPLVSFFPEYFFIFCVFIPDPRIKIDF